MIDDLPDQFDLVVIGTGFTESCVAAGASRIGKTVLHIDTNEYYGGVWTSLTLNPLNDMLDHWKDPQLKNGSYKFHVAEDYNEDSTWTRKKLLEKARNFNLDLCPKVLYSTGAMVKLLVESNICRYAEFRVVDCVCTMLDGKIINVPCTRSGIFNSSDLSIVEKRLLMKFLQACMSFKDDKALEDTIQYRGRTFQEYINDQSVTPKIRTCIMQAIAMCDEETSFEVGMERTQKFLQSLNVYGDTPLIFPMYGCGELPQYFCRLCAVFGGIYCLKRNIESIRVDENQNAIEININGKLISAKHLVTSQGYIPEYVNTDKIYGFGGESKPYLSRAILIGTKPIGDKKLNSGGGGVNILRLTLPQREAFLIQLSHYSGICPKDTYIFHLTTPAISDNPELDVSPFLAQVFNESSCILYSAYFTLMTRSCTPQSEGNWRVFCTASPYYELDYDLSIKNASKIFELLYPNEQFLPRAPNPEEIVIDGEDPRALNEQSLPEDLRAQLHELESKTANMDIEDNNV